MADQDVDLILTDINMPEMDGLKFLSLIRQQDDYKNIPVIILTTEGDDDNREKGQSLGADGFIVKPFEASNLIETIQKVLEQK